MSARRARCHPERRHHARGLCVSCYVRRYKVPAGAQGRPGAGSARRAVTEAPAACPKCGAGALREAGPQVSCLLCGWDAWRLAPEAERCR